MEKFLKNVVDYLYKSYKSDFSELCIVFPGHRAVVFFNQYLSEITDKPLWTPTFLSINELMYRLADEKPTDRLALVFQLYKSYIKEKKSEESFDDFYHWGEMLLSDFDNVDKYLVPAKSLFQNISSLKEIDKQFNFLTKEQIDIIKQFWENFDPEKGSKHKKDFIDIWKVLYDIYTSFRQSLKAEDKAYEGMVYREVAEKIEQNELKEFPFKKYIFIGFNALNNCEESLFKYLKQSNLAEFFWDYDLFYIKKQYHEAGLFLRRNIQQFPSPNDFVFSDNEMLSSKKKIRVISTPSDITQAKILRQLIEDQRIDADRNFKDFAIILADEGMLFPVINSLPDEVKDINITMGYPLKATAVNSLLDDLLLIQKNSRTKDTQSLFYYKEVLSLMNHRYIRFNNSDLHKTLKDTIINNNMIFVSSEYFENDELFSKIFKKISSHIEFSNYLIEILFAIFSKMQSKDKVNTAISLELDKEFIYRLFLIVKRLNELIGEKGIKLKLDTYIKLLKGLIKNITIPFIGEPLQGIQIMGILESRVLDFKNIIILSMNEGILPKTETASSYIPYNLKRGFGIPVIEQQDAMYAYYFYRIIQRAENVTLVYSEAGDEMASGEMSRFLYQLINNNELIVKKSILSFEINSNQPKEIIIEKSNQIINKLSEYLQTGKRSFSPSAINTYIDCTLKFYFRYIAGIYKQNDVKQDVDPALFGLLLHHAMSVIYTPFLEKVISKDDIEAIYNNKEIIDSAINLARKKEVSEENVNVDISGANIITYDVIFRYIRNILKQDKKYAPFTLMGLEKKLTYNFPVLTNENDDFVKISGTIDRIDKIANEIRIIDYKTGETDLKFKGVDSLFLKGNDKRKKAVLQTFIYARCFKENTNSTNKIVPGLYFIRSLFSDDFDYHIINSAIKSKVEDTEIYDDDFDDNLRLIFEELFNKDIAFVQTENDKICQYCDYKEICNKEVEAY